MTFTLDERISVTPDLYAELCWLSALLRFRLDEFDQEDDQALPVSPPPPLIAPGSSPFAELIGRCELSPPERALVALALCPWLCPFLLDPLLEKDPVTQRGRTELGGAVGVTHGGFLPTGETAVFLLGGTDLSLRRHAMSLLAPTAVLAKEGLVSLGETADSDPFLAGVLQPGPRLRAVLFPEFFSADGVAGRSPLLRPLESDLDWNDLVLPTATLSALEEIHAWHLHHRTLLVDWGLRGRLRSGCVNLFYGPSGTGKSLAAAVLGKRCQCPVLRLDLSAVVSKYVGETEKNLSAALSQAESQGATLVCDEGESLFSRRNRAESAQETFVNQQVSFLLQRIEEFSGIIILTSNLRMNIDDAFLRRFHSVVEFPMPEAAERLRLWQSAFGDKLEIHAELSLEKISEKYELTGGSIVNVVRLAALRAAVRGDRTIVQKDLIEGIRREYRKEGRPI